jgi:hypothetical protein
MIDSFEMVASGYCDEFGHMRIVGKNLSSKRNKCVSMVSNVNDTNMLWHQRVNPTKYGSLWHMTWLHMVYVGVNLLGHKINHINCKMGLEILLYSGPSESLGFIFLRSLAYEMYPRTNELLYFLIWYKVINTRCLLYGFE